MQRVMLGLCCGVVAGLVVSVSAVELTPEWKSGLRFTAEDGSATIKVGGRLMTDAAFAEDDLWADEEGTEIRRARFFISGVVYENIEFKLQCDLAGAGKSGSSDTISYLAPDGTVMTTEVLTSDGNEVSVKDAYVGLRGLSVGNVRVGHFTEAFCMNDITSSKYITFVERALPALAFAPGRNTGIMLSNSDLVDGRMLCAVGAWKDTSDGHRKGSGGWSYGIRVGGEPVRTEDAVLYLGAACSLRDARSDEVSYSARPEVNLISSLVGGEIAADGQTLVGAELATVVGRFHGAAEYIAVDIDSDGGNVALSGFYVQGGVFLTGEHRSFSGGEWGRTKPVNAFGKSGRGALELKARYSMLDLQDGGFVGGEEENITVGLNWYLNANTRLMVDCVMVDAELADGSDVDGVAGVSRLQIDF